MESPRIRRTCRALDAPSRQEISASGTISLRRHQSMPTMRRPPDIIIRRVLAAARASTRTFRGNIGRNHFRPAARSVTSSHVLGVLARASTVNPHQFLRLRSHAGCDTGFCNGNRSPGTCTTPTWEHCTRPQGSSAFRTGNNLHPSITPFSVSVYPIQQEPGVWFANYMISEYKDGAERIVANVSMRHATHHTKANARQAARSAGESAVGHLRLQPFPHRHPMLSRGTR